MRVDGGDASRMARMAALTDRGAVDTAAREHARGLRLGLMVELRRTMEAHTRLAEAVRAVVEDGTDLVLEDSPYPDDAHAYDLVQGPAVAYEQLGSWVASLEGRPQLARLVLDGMAARTPSALPKRAIVGADGLMLLVNGATVFGGDYLATVRERHGPLFEVTFFELELGGMVEVSTVDGGLKLRVTPQDARDPRCLHALLLEAQESLRQGVELGEKMVREGADRV